MRTLFTQEEIALLEKNNYTHLVSKSMIKFTDDFKDDFWRLYLTDLPVKEIFRMLGYDPEVIGTKRIDGFVYNLRKARLTEKPGTLYWMFLHNPQNIPRKALEKPPRNFDYPTATQRAKTT